VQNLTASVQFAKKRGSTSIARATTSAKTAKKPTMRSKKPKPIEFAEESKQILYNRSLYTSITLLYFTRLFYEKLPRNVDVLLSRGASGCSLAAALILYAGLRGRRLNHVHFRKKSELAHSNHAGTFDEDMSGDHVYCVVDDFISSGETLREILEKADTFKLPRPIYVLVSYLIDPDILDSLPKQIKLICVED